MKVPAFAEHRHDRGVGGKQRPDVAVILRLDPLAAGGAKGHKLGVLPLGFVDPPEKLQVLGVRARVSRLDKRNPQLIQLCTIASLSSTERKFPLLAPSLRVESKISTDRSMMLFLSIILQIVFSVKISNFAPAA